MWSYYINKSFKKMVNPINIYYDSVCGEKIYQNYDYV